MSGIWILKIAIPTSFLFPSRRIKWPKTLSKRANVNKRKEISEGCLVVFVRFSSRPVFAHGQNTTIVFEHRGVVKVYERH